jgi:hypothetical protein
MTTYALYISSLSNCLTVKQLLLEAKDRGLSNYSRLNKAALIQLLKSDTNRSQFERLEPLNYPLVANKPAKVINQKPVEVSRKYSIPSHIKQGFWKQGVFYPNRVVSSTQGQGIGIAVK